MRDITDRVRAQSDFDCVSGRARWCPVKSIWFTAMLSGWIIGGILYFSWASVLVFFGLSAVILCGGHSLGMHRKLIHDSFTCSKGLERFGVYLGTLVGLGGPFTMMQTHDMRDWAQRQVKCHDFFSHNSAPLKDFWLQIHCKLYLGSEPDFVFPKKLTQSKFMILLQRTAMLQQIPLGILLFYIGGWGFVFWGICGRISVSIFGHWLIGYIAHNRGKQDWVVSGACVQGYNVKFCGLITFGECWHNNHHAYPESARLGHAAGQIDPGWWVLKTLERIGLVSGLKLPEDLPKRDALIEV